VKAAGGEIVVFSPEKGEHSKGLADKQNLTFPIVQDTALGIARAFGLVFTLPDDLRAVYQGFGLDLPKNTGHAAWELPVPSRFVVDRGGIVRAVDADPDYTVRPEADATLAILRSL
jgi:peroxiredoxin